MNKIKIGFIDSGVGGLFFANDLVSSIFSHRNLFVSNFFKKNVEFLHFGDTKNMPYGVKTKEQLEKLSKDLIQLAHDNGCKIIFIACNTADSVLTDETVDYFKKKGVELIRIIKQSSIHIYNKTKAVNNTKNILILATKRTIESQSYQNEIIKYSLNFPNIKTNVVGYFPENIEFSIENGASKKNLVEVIEKYYLENKKMIENVMSIGLFCTHFAYFDKELKMFLKKMNHTTIKAYSQGAFFKKNIISILKQEIANFKEIEDINKLKSLKGSKIEIKSFLTSQRDIEQYQKTISNFSKNLLVDFKIL